MKKYTVIQWATGVVGAASLRGIIRNPILELVGVKVYSDEKEGREAGAQAAGEPAQGST